MYTFITASKDAAIYNEESYQNTGYDEILEVGAYIVDVTKYKTRSLIKFETSHISQSLAIYNAQSASSLFTASLLLIAIEFNEIPATSTIYAYPVSQSWEEGVGTLVDKISTKGVSWWYRNGESQTLWHTDADDNIGQELTGSIGTSLDTDGRGGTWYTSSLSKTYSYKVEDLEIDITSFVKNWLSGSVANEGIVLKLLSDLESDDNDYGKFKFFSKQTNTIYQPKLILKWDETFNEGTGSVLGQNYRTFTSNLNSEYKLGQRVKIEVKTREKYPTTTYSTFGYDTYYNLPSSSYYEIIDSKTGDVIIPFSSQSKLNRDSSSAKNYFYLNLSNFEKGRNYTINVKIEEDFSQQIFNIGNFDIV